MVQTLLNDMHSQQLQKYNDEAHSIYELDYRNPSVKESEVVLVNLAAEYLGLKKTIELIKACHARVVSLILWDPENDYAIPCGGHWSKSYRTILPEQAVMEFQARDMDLVFMRKPQDEEGNRLIRLDFESM